MLCHTAEEAGFTEAFRRGLVLSIFVLTPRMRLTRRLMGDEDEILPGKE